MIRLLIIMSLTLSLSAQVLEPVEYVNPKQFSGLWYEIARTYNSQQEDCVASSVEYILEEEKEHEYRVFNRCFDTKIGGDLIEYKGSGEPTEGSSMSRIDLTYYWVFTREFRVVYLSPDYQTAVMCDDEMDKVWIMHRKPQLPRQKLNDVLALLEPSLELKRLIYTPQDSEGRYK
jgi:apolipoprotein D and lipocalin family protein